MSDLTLHWESHACLPLHPQASFAPIDRLRAAGVDYVSINVGMDMNPVQQVMAVIAGFRATIASQPDKYVQANTLADIQRAKSSEKIAIGFDLEGAMPLMEQPEMVALYAALGVRQIHFAYNRNNSVADGCHDVERGLTPLGVRMVQAVNAAGMLMDCSHTGRRCSLDIMAASSQPVIFSHANPLALVEHGRNITDAQIRACASTGGVVCVSGVSFFLGNTAPTVQDVARHAAYVADLVGVQHVGIGLDISFPQRELNDDPPVFNGQPYEPSYWWPKAAGYDRAILRATYTPVETWQVLAQALQDVGMSADDAALVMGGNMLRVARKVWH
ncbi:dipeptidase [Rhodoferax sp.]|uniref:dipeptidase n=1 Tax=Rhodoferax sp. TaxID=50421 RepID=UPI00374D556E